VRWADMWNLRALLHTDGSVQPAEAPNPLERGAPREQGHYGFMLTDLYLLPLLAGQTADLPRGRLTLRPRFPPPYVLPVLLAGVEGMLTSRTRGEYNLTIVFGRLRLPAGGLIVDGHAWQEPLDLQGGRSRQGGGPLVHASIQWRVRV